MELFIIYIIKLFRIVTHEIFWSTNNIILNPKYMHKYNAIVYCFIIFKHEIFSNGMKFYFMLEININMFL